MSYTKAGQKEAITDQLEYWLALGQKSYYFPANLVAKAIEQLSSIEDLWYADDTILAQIGFGLRSIQEFRKIRSDSTLENCRRLMF